MTVPVGNLYRLLCYAWDVLDVGDPARVSAEPFETAAGLLTHVLEQGALRLLRRGPDRGYTRRSETTRRPRGRIDVPATVHRNLLAVPAVRATFDELTHDTLASRVLKATLFAAGRPALVGRFADVVDVPLSEGLFRQARLTRTSRPYKLLLHVCELLFRGMVPDPRTGGFVFTDVVRDERRMAELFEAFVRNFYRIEQTTFPVVRRERFDWTDTTGDVGMLPELRTDVCLISDTRKLVIDAKYYTATLGGYFDAGRVRAGHLYQLFAYLANVRRRPGQVVEGMLLYPTVDRELDLRYTLHGYPVRVATVDLARPWDEVHGRMLALLAPANPVS